jgi:hypothetical protein
MSRCAKIVAAMTAAAVTNGWAGPDDGLTARSEAESLGRAVFEAESAGAIADQMAVAAARSRVVEWCDFEYKAIVVPEGAGQTVFFIAQPKTTENLVLGRHYRVGEKLIEASTKSCLAIPKPEPGKPAAAAWTTHLLSEYPTAFHVYLSLKYRQPIYVGIKREMWKIENGRITWGGRT